MRAAVSPDLSVEAVTVTYANGHTALHDAGFRLEAGTICGLAGINGAGKSTLFKAIMGLVRPTSGRVLIGGEPVEAALRRNRVAYVPQSEEVDWTFPVSVRDVVMMGRYGHMNILRIPRATDRAAVAGALERVGMGALADRQIGELSGGQRKRVFLARAMAQGAELLLLDEPFTGVDATTEQAIIALLKGFRAEGRIVLVSTHDLGSIPEFCDEVVLVNRTVLAAGPTTEVFTEENLRMAFGGALRHPARLPQRQTAEQTA
jgi:manganese/iron transport system ATP-binding protein